MAACAIAQCTDLWCDVKKVIKTVQLIQQDKASKHAKELATQTYYKILQIVPSLKSTIDEPATSAEPRDICLKMNVMIRATHSSDAARLKPHIPQYAAPNPFKAVLDPPNYALQRFDENPMQEIEDLASGTIPMEAKDYPALFWSRSMPGSDYNADNMLDGLFKSYFLIRVGRHIFMGPSSALGGDSCNAMHNMSIVEVEHIAYICVQSF
ncbi:hypothetical protein BS17DRAFT_765006 [Gyrodon lividus]|nr:hypothetical protein BS17DRAFT_765006 [Gyrodon lividus]